MIKPLLIAFVCLATLPDKAVAHTSFPREIQCPLDSTKFTIYVTGSYTTFGSFKDFQKTGAIGDLYESYVNSCPKCHFSGYTSDFDTFFTGEHKKTVQDLLFPYRNAEMTDVLENEITAAIYLHYKKPNDEIGSLYLVASYFLRHAKDSIQVTKRKALQQTAASYFIKALTNSEYSLPAVASMNYLVGELYRRVGEFDTAIKYYDLAMDDPNKKDWVMKVATEQKKLALAKDDNNDI